MNANQVQYLKSIGMEDPFVERVAFLMTVSQKCVPQVFEEIFVSEHVNSEGVREYESVWFFSDKYACEAKNFVKEVRFDTVPYKRILYWEISLKDFDLGRADQKSRMKLEVKFNTLINGVLKASGSNCEKLHKLYLERFMPHVCLGGE